MSLRRVVLTVVLPLLFLLAPAVSWAQKPIGPPAPAAGQCQEDCGGYSVIISTPSAVSHPSNSGPYSMGFEVENNGTLWDTYTVTCVGFGGVTCTGVTPAAFALYPSTNQMLSATYTVGATGGSIRVTVTGAASVSVTMVVNAQLMLRNMQADNWERGSCLVAGAGEAAWVCGDLLVSHAMPGYTTLGKERSLGLVYSSAQAVPRPTVTATISRSSGDPVPTAILAELKVNTGAGFVVRASTSYSPWTVGPFSRQIALSYDASGDATGVYPFLLTITNQGTSMPPQVVAGNLAVVNRIQSPSGQGWRIAGVEELVFAQPVSTGAGGILRVASEGSTRMYWPGVSLVASNLAQSGMGGWSAAAAVDGNTSSNAWHTDQAVPGAFVRADLGTAKVVTTTRVYANANQTAIYNIQYSDDDLLWTTVYQGFAPVPGWSAATWPSAGAHRYWRLVLTNTPGTGGWVTELSLGSPSVYLGGIGGRADSLVKFDSVGVSWYRRILAHGVTVLFNSSGKHVQTANRVGQVTTFAYDGSSRLTTVTVPPGPTGYSYQLLYDTNGLDRIIDPANRVLDATISGGKLATLTDPDGIGTSFGYDGAGRMTQRTNRRGVGTTFEYANGQRVTKARVPFGPTGADTAVTLYQAWDEWGRAGTAAVAVDSAFSRILGPRVGLADDATFWVDRWGGAIKIRDALGATTTIERGNLAYPAVVTKVSYPNGRIATMTYDSRGRLAGIRDSTSHLGAAGLPTKVTTYTYADAATPDSPTRVQDALGRKTDYAYNSLGLTDSIVDQRGHRTKFVYQTTGTLKGQLLQVIERAVPTWRESDSVEVTLDQTQSFGYSATTGNLLTSTNAAGATTSYTADATGRVTDVYDPLQGRQAYGYDPLNRTTSSVHYTGTYAHPGVSNPLAGCNASYFVCADSTHNYNPAGSSLTTLFRFSATTLDTVIDPLGVRRSYAYDANGAQRLERDEFNLAKTATYDAGGLLTSVVSREGLVVRHYYDLLGRRTAMAYSPRTNQFPGDPNTVVGDSLVYGYDVMGNLLQATNREGTITRTYYADGSLRSKKTSVPADSLHYSYDATGALTKIVYQGVDSVRYSYTSTGDLDSLIAVFKTDGAPRTRVFRFTWDALGRRKQIVYPENGMVVTFAYDQLGGIRRLQSVNNATPVGTNRFRFTHRNRQVDPTGHILQQTTSCEGYAPGDPEKVPCGAYGAPRTVTNRYNRLGMLVSQAVQNETTDSMRYDGSGNMTLKVSQTNGGPLRRQAFTSLAGSNRLASDSTFGDPFKVSFSYSASGSRTREDPSLQTGGTVNLFRRYYYDGLGRMTGTRHATWNGNGWDFHGNPDSCHYDADGNTTVACDNLTPRIAFDGANATKTDDGWRFIHGPGLDDPLVAIRRNISSYAVYGGEIYEVTDGQGRQFAVGRADGSLSEDEQGGTIAASGWRYAGATQKAQGFGADRLSTSSAPSISLFRNRAYDSRTGRWTQEDPIGVAGGINLYQFNGNNPVAYTDPFGLCPEDKGGDGKTDTLDDCPEGSEGWKERRAELQREQDIRECFDRNTRWLRSEDALITATVGVGGGLAGVIGGAIANGQGSQLLYSGAVDLDLFFGVPNSSSALVESGLQAQSAGRFYLRTGRSLVRGGATILAAQATFVFFYLATTYTTCRIDPEY